MGVPALAGDVAEVCKMANDDATRGRNAAAKSCDADGPGRRKCAEALQQLRAQLRSPVMERLRVGGTPPAANRYRGAR